MFVKTNTKVFNTRARNDLLSYKFKKGPEAKGLDLERNQIDVNQEQQATQHRALGNSEFWINTN